MLSTAINKNQHIDFANTVVECSKCGEQVVWVCIPCSNKEKAIVCCDCCKCKEAKAMSKGSKQRPTDEKAYGDNYDRIFNKSKQDEMVELSEWTEALMPEYEESGVQGDEWKPMETNE